MKKTTKFLFGIHMHQPIDNFDWVIEKAVNLCYAPFFATMRAYPEFKFSVHCSGWLMEQIKMHYKDLYNDIKYLTKRGSIEFLSAGYYEPILSAIPSQDRVAQIDLLSKSISKDFKQTPKGLWLTERVWESTIIPDLASCGIEYTLMDDYHFESAGFEASQLDGYFMSEESGKEIALFPINKALRYAIPFLNVNAAINAIKMFDAKDDSAAILFDDAEKFGMWPKTHEWVYEKEWLRRFVEAVLADEAIETIHFSAYKAATLPRGIAYLPNVSYYEMGEWSLASHQNLALQALKNEVSQEHLRGGIWKNFLIKYSESNRIHKRTLELSNAASSVNKKSFKTALYKAQANDSLWHGVFGGLYLGNLRDNVYTYIIEAENIRYANKELITLDNNELDGYAKAKMITPNTILRFDSAYGGQLVEFDARDVCFNYQNTLMHRPEAYHELIRNPQAQSQTEADHDSQDRIETIHHAHIEVSEELKNALIYDWHQKNSFIDHISDMAFNAQNFKYADFREYGDFANQAFTLTNKKESLSFERHGGIYDGRALAKEYHETTLSKNFTPLSDGVAFTIDLTSSSEFEYLYALEMNFHFAKYEKLTLNTLPLEEIQTLKDVSKIELFDNTFGKKIRLTLDQNATLHAFVLSTLSQSEEGFDLSPQGVSLALVFRLHKNLHISGTLEIKNV